MPPTSKAARRPLRDRASVGEPSDPRASSPATIATNRLNELAEALDITLSELAARIEALEHLLVESRLCTLDDLIRSREVVDRREIDR